MVSRDAVMAVLDRVMELSDADQTQAVLMMGDTYLTRFAENYIHQNVGESGGRLMVKAVLDGRVGNAATSGLDDDSIRHTVRRAIEIAGIARQNPQLGPLPAPPPVDTEAGFAGATAGCSPEARAGAVRTIVDQALAADCRAAGSFTTASSQLAVANSLGARAYQAGTRADLRTVVMSQDGGAGWGAAASRQVEDISAPDVGRAAVDKCVGSRGAGSIEPGQYQVILEPEATAELVAYLARLGFGALAVQEGRSFLCNRLGEQVVGENIDIWDDGTDLSGLPMAFDFEGVPKRRLPLVEAGRAVNLLHDSQTAHRAGEESTGHAIPTPYAAYGPMALNLFMQGGSVSLEEMIGATQRGILVTRFHYTNPLHPIKALITGMTRDGTFLVEGGRVTRPVRNLRFTESVLKALSSVDLIGSDARLVGGYFGGTVAPSVRISSFNFTGVTEH